MKKKSAIGKIKEAKKIVFIFLFGIILFGAMFSAYNRLKPGEGQFKVNTVLLKSVIVQGDFVTSKLKITNTKEESQNFKIKIMDLKDLIFIDGDLVFRLNPGETHEINLVFDDRYSKYSPGIYSGSLIISSDSGKKTIMTVLEIQSNSPVFATNLNVAPSYKEVAPGEELIMGIKVFNLKDADKHTIVMRYLVKDKEGENIFSETETLVVDTEVEITRTINLPENIEEGDYLFGVIAKSGDSVSTSSYLFSVSKSEEKIRKKFSLGPAGQGLTLIFSSIIAVFLLAIVILVVYMFHERDRLFFELRRQHLQEMKLYIGKIKKKEVCEIRKAKTRKERKQIKRIFREAKKKARRKLKEKQKKQKIIFKQLRKKGKHKSMELKLKEWRKQGFNVEEFMHLKNRKNLNPKSALNRWREKGFDTSSIKKA